MRDRGKTENAEAEENGVTEMDAEKNRKITEDIAGITESIISMSKKPEATRAALDRVLSLRGQLAVEPMISGVPADEIIKTYDYDDVVIYRCKSAVVWKNKGGRTITVFPTMRAEFGFLTQMLDMKDAYDTLPQELKDVYDGCFLGYSAQVNLPSVSSVNDKYFAEVSMWCINEIRSIYEEEMGKPLQEETVEENTSFEIKRNAMDGIAGETQND